MCVILFGKSNCFVENVKRRHILDMNNINKWFLIILLLCLIAFLPSGCKKRNDEKKDGINILCTIYPVWLLTANIASDAEGINLELLLPANASPHSKGLHPKDMEKIARADIIIFNGYDVEFEMQIEDAIRRENPEAVKIIASEGVKPLFYGEEVEDDEHEENHHEHQGHEHKAGSRDPHTWVSPKQAIILAENIRDGLIKADEKNAKKYRENADKFIEQLKNLVAEFEEASKQFKKRNIVTGHMAFGYLARDFNLNIVSVIEIIPMQEPSASELIKITEKIKEKQAAAIFIEPLVRKNVAETLSEATGIPVRVLHPCDIGNMEPGEYIRNMRNNIKELKNALM